MRTTGWGSCGLHGRHTAMDASPTGSGMGIPLSGIAVTRFVVPTKRTVRELTYMGAEGQDAPVSGNNEPSAPRGAGDNDLGGRDWLVA